MDQSKLVRLQKVISECGVSSRRKAEYLISIGKVKVNGKVAEIGDKVDPQKDIIQVNGKEIKQATRKYYIMLHKPRGYITTMVDEKDRKCVAELVKDVPERVYPVGRLDRDSEGLLLMTNDGEFANGIIHPSRHVSKVYRVTVKPDITEDQLVKMSVGMVIDGRKTEPAQIKLISKLPGRVVLQIILKEGRNRQIRKMCEMVGLEVARLKRISIGQLKLGMLQPGKWRELTSEEVRLLKKSSESRRISR